MGAGAVAAGRQGPATGSLPAGWRPEDVLSVHVRSRGVHPLSSLGAQSVGARPSLRPHFLSLSHATAVLAPAMPGGILQRGVSRSGSPCRSGAGWGADHGACCDAFAHGADQLSSSSFEEELDGQHEERRRKCPGRRRPSRAARLAGPAAARRPLAPVRLRYTRGSRAALDDAAGDPDRIRLVRSGKFAKSSRLANRSKERWWAARCRARRLAPYPLTRDKVELAAALLRAGGYRSGALYLSHMKRCHVSKGFAWNEGLTLAQRDGVRAITRGMGPPAQAEPWPIESFCSQASRLEAASRAETYWPVGGAVAAIIGTMWLLREVELGSALRSAVKVHPPSAASEGCGWVEWDLPVSKTDQMALGRVRSLGCACPAPLCPVVLMRELLEAGSQALGRRAADPCAPLVVNAKGTAVTKHEFTLYLRDLARLAGSGPGGPAPGRITGHSMRVAGAMRMAAAGHTAWVIQVFGRWGSAVVLRYVREALLGARGGTIAATTEQAGRLTLEDLVAGAARRVPGGVGPHPPAAEGGAPRSPATAALRRHLAREAAEMAFQSLSPKLSALESAAIEDRVALAHVAGCVNTLAKDIIVVGGSGTPEHVLGPSGVLHATASPLRTMCGWEWGCQGAPALGARGIAAPGLALPSGAHEGARCKRCFRGSWPGPGA